MMPTHLALPVTDSSHVGEARRQAARLTSSLDATTAGAAALVVTELATNLLKHGGGGELLVRAAPQGLEVLALDRGRGISDIERCLADGYSTAGSPGTGLGAVRRVSKFFDIHSVAGAGTATLACVRAAASARPTGAWMVGGVSVARHGEDLCGDDWAVCEERERLTVLVVDGLGHGIAAHTAARAAVEAFEKDGAGAPAAIVQHLQMALRPTRGAAIGVAQIDERREVVTFCGVGNIAGTIFASTGTRQVVSLPGIVGHEVRKVVEFTYPWGPDGVLVLHSDGVRSPGLVTERDPGLLARHPSLVAGVLYRDLKRERDDATVVVVRRRQRLS